MRVFLTGATGFIGTHLIPELLAAGHEVIGLTRSDAGERQLAKAGVAIHSGTLEDPDSLRRGAAQADAVIHAAFDHDFTNFLANCEKDRRAIAALGEALAGSDRPLLITSGVGMGDPGDGQPATEQVLNLHHPNPRVGSEAQAQALVEAGIDVRVIRLPQVHDTVRQGLITPFIAIAREQGVAAYLGEGTNRWAAAHVVDVARLYRLALERGHKGARYHAVAEDGVPARAIVDVVAAGLGVPTVSLTAEQAPAHFGWFAMFAGMDVVASSAWTRAELGWNPVGPGLIEDLRAMDYATAPNAA
ncbi:SDR family oxidoreductase [Novosphingobium sp. FSW06-99]|uniref:SDR family oxidoreductase n=1 Tax=Novosphingobium sp. FSW06-99 TaxID=1739113 RepID=UPI00076BCCED|nr:SDR family oxidoreductase [Novosphingobium sp. FSW06-99]KUR75386.1 NAD-dependent dehydratase [Novosphingobium sp. FSW06-99]